jgi:hypothetical protein
MAELTRGTVSGPATYLPPYNAQHTGHIAGEALTNGDMTYLNADGKVYKASGAAANAAARTRGMVLRVYPIGDEGVTIWNNIVVNYGSGFTPGNNLYLSGTVAGGLADAASTGGTTPVGYVDRDGSRIVLYVL